MAVAAGWSTTPHPEIVLIAQLNPEPFLYLHPARNLSRPTRGCVPGNLNSSSWSKSVTRASWR